MMTPEQVSADPVVRALRPIRAPYLAPLSEHSDLEVWHLDLAFEEWMPPAELLERWSQKDLNVAETWQKRPLITGAESGRSYSCGEVEIAARLRNAGFRAFWMSEWAGFPHVKEWATYCIKRNEFRDRAEDLWRYDQDLRTNPTHANALGRTGGHPDIACVTPKGMKYLEYKGPGTR